MKNANKLQPGDTIEFQRGFDDGGNGHDWEPGKYVEKSDVGRSWHVIEGLKPKTVELPDGTTRETKFFYVPASRIRRPGSR